MRKLFTGLILGAVVMSGAAQANTYKAENRLVVTGVSSGSFSVPSNGKFGARSSWCAAAGYAQDVLGASNSSRVYVQKPKQTNSGPVVFGLTPGGATPVAVTGTTAALRAAGSNLTVSHALQFCKDRFQRRDN